MSSSAITGPILADTRRAPSGTAAAPSFAFNDSTGTGVYLVSAGVLGLSTNGAQRVVVDASGNVGIGVTPSAYKLEVSSGYVGIRRGISYNASASVGIDLGASNADSVNTSATYAWGQEISGDATGQALTFKRYRRSDTTVEAMRIDANGALTVGSAGTSITHTIQAPSNPAGTPAVYIRKQNVAINSSGNSYIEFYGASGGYDGYLGITGTTLQVVDSSDSRKKENIRPANYGLKEIQALKPAVFDWKEDFGGEKNIKGFIAQEVKEVLPECVTIKDESEHGGLVDSHFLGTATMIPVLVAAIQEQQAMIEALKAEVAALKAP
jgi:hypothetical protein